MCFLRWYHKYSGIISKNKVAGFRFLVRSGRRTQVNDEICLSVPIEVAFDCNLKVRQYVRSCPAAPVKSVSSPIYVKL